MSAIARLGLVVAAFVLQTAFLNAALPTGPQDAPARASLAGQFLVAAPEMGDPRFEQTIIDAIGLDTYRSLAAPLKAIARLWDGEGES